MIDARTGTVTDLMRQMRDIAGQLVELLGPEIVSYEIIRGDYQRKREEMAAIEAKKATVLLEIESVKASIQNIRDTAKEEANRIIEDGKATMLERLSQVNRLLAVVEQFVPEMDKKRYMALRKESDKLAEKAA